MSEYTAATVYQCPVCGASGDEACSTKRGTDHKARALGWTTVRRPKS